MKDNNNMTYAIVENNIVTNIIWLYPGTEFPNAVSCDGYPVTFGDTYENGHFYRDGVLLKTELEEMQEALSILGVEP